MATPIHILIVEDHDALRESLCEIVQKAGYATTAVDSAEALADLPANPWHIALLDLNLPGEDGLSLAMRLRRIKPALGIIMLTARTTVRDKITGYDNGADIYHPKPAAPAELICVIQALSRRIAPYPTTHPLHLNLKTRVIEQQGKSISLREAEFILLHALALAPQNRLETWQLLEQLNRPMDDLGKRQLAVTISRLREKLETHGFARPAIQAERGLGYRLTFDMSIE